MGPARPGRRMGFVPAHRKMYEPDHWLAPTKRDPSNRRDAWLDLCQMATHAERETRSSGTLERGEIVASLRTLGGRWHWSKDRVARFMSDLEVRTAIATVRDTPDGTVYRIVNYDTYAVLGDSERDTGSDSGRDRSETEARQEQPLNHEKPMGGRLTESDSRPSRKRAKALPDSWEPTDSHRVKADDLNVSVEQEEEKFRLHARANHRTQVDWDASFHMWLKKAAEFQRPKAQAPRPGPQVPRVRGHA